MQLQTADWISVAERLQLKLEFLNRRLFNKHHEVPAGIFLHKPYTFCTFVNNMLGCCRPGRCWPRISFSAAGSRRCGSERCAVQLGRAASKSYLPPPTTSRVAAVHSAEAAHPGLHRRRCRLLAGRPPRVRHPPAAPPAAPAAAVSTAAGAGQCLPRRRCRPPRC